jgi:Glycosyltransferase family 87/WD40-like Beta Propeller Repeat
METDFPNNYTAAVLTLKHQPLRQYYDWVWFQRQMHYAGIEHQIGGYVPNTPLTMLPMLPLAAFPPQRAKQIWMVLEVLLLVGSIVVLARLSRLGILEVTVLALLAYKALGSNFQTGQYYILILLLMACGTWCLLRGREAWGGGIVGLICALKLYTAPFVFYFLARRQWKALAGFVGAGAALAVLAIGMFGWDGVWFFATTVMVQAADGSPVDPYSPSLASMTAFLRRMLLPEAGLNPHPAWPAPAAFFFLKTAYSIGLLVLSLVALARRPRDREDEAIGWFVIVLFVLSPNQASYRFLGLLVAVVLLLPGASRRWAAGLIALYLLVELPLSRWAGAFFPHVWVLLVLFFYAGWSFLRQIGRARLMAAMLVVALVAGASTFLRLQTYWKEPPQANPHAAVDSALYASAPVFGSNGWMYEAMGDDRYVLRRLAASGVQTFAFDGDAFHPAESQHEGPIFFELVRDGLSQIQSFDLKTRSLKLASSADQNASEPALSQDGTKLVYVASDALYLKEGERRRILTAGPASNPAFFPGGTRIAFAQGVPGRRSIAIISTTSGTVLLLVKAGDCFEPAVSPDGRLLAFACSEMGARQVWVRDLITGVSRRLSRGSCNNDAPAWDPDSRSVVFASDCGRGVGMPALYRARVTDSGAD